MTTRTLTTGLALGLLLTATSNSAEARTLDVHCTFSSTFVQGVETHLDTNGDGLSAGSHQGLENCTIGKFFLQDVSEYQAPLPAPVTCPAGTLELHLQQNHGVATAENGDQLFFEVATNGGTLCLNLSDLTFRSSAQGTITRGTGQFAGASGTFRTRASGRYLVTGEKGGVVGGFGQFTGRSRWTLTLPDGAQPDDAGDKALGPDEEF